jgi:peptidoglycan/LPS O-acetylase OafA/YrhL
LEGLRGVAAMQVVLLHFVTAFLPDAADHAAPPLRILFDGHTAVYVFFLISGMVLTPSFDRGGTLAAQAFKRLARLGVPVAAAAVCALALLAAMPGAHLTAAAISGSAWLAMDSSGAPTLVHLLREITLDSLMLGYREYTLFAPITDRLPLLEHSLDAPFWSLHLELYGSLLVLGLTRLRTRSKWPYRAAVLVCAALFGPHPMFLFVLGHLCSSWIGRSEIPGVGAALIGLGLAMSASKDWLAAETLRTAIGHLTPVAVPNPFQFQSQLAAIALFLGVLLSPLARRSLSFGPCRQLGRLSFSIYLLHFPILFTLPCVTFPSLVNVLPYPTAIFMTLGGFMVMTFASAFLFERWVDRPAIQFSRWIARRIGV